MNDEEMKKFADNDRKWKELSEESNRKLDEIISKMDGCIRILRRMYWKERIYNWRWKYRRILKFTKLYNLILRVVR